MHSSHSSISPDSRHHLRRSTTNGPSSRPTEVGWDEDDDEDLARYMRTESRQRARDAPLSYAADALPEKMTQRKRAMSLGHFKVRSRFALST